jgi:hypothetical protein
MDERSLLSGYQVFKTIRQITPLISRISLQLLYRFSKKEKYNQQILNLLKNLIKDLILGFDGKRGTNILVGWKWMKRL